MRWTAPTLLTLASCGIVASAVSIDPPAIAETLLPHAGAPQIDRLETGAVILRVLLLFDAALLLLLAARMRTRRGERSTTREGAGTDDVRTGEMWALVGLLALAGAMRFVGLDGDLWMDEVFTLVNYVQPGLGTVVGDFTDDNQHVLYSLSAWLSTRLLGETPAALRLPALLFGLASIWATLRLGRCTIGVREAWLSAILLAVSYHHVWFSQNARGYTILLCATLLATDLFRRALESGSVRVWIAYAVTLAFGMWAHLTMIFVAAAHGLIVVGRALRAGTGGTRVAPLWALTLTGWLTLHLYALTIPQVLDYFTDPGAGSTTAAVEWTKPIWIFNETVRNLGVGLELGWLGAGSALLFGAYGLLRVWRRDRLLTLGMLLPAVLGGLTMVGLGRNLWPRFFFNSFGFVALVAMSGAVGLGDSSTRAWPRGRNVLAIAPALLLLLASAATLPRVYRHPKQDYTSARDYVRANLVQGDEVVALHMAGHVYSRYYAPEWPEVSNLEELMSHRAGDGRTWVLYTLPSYLAASQPELVEMLESEFELLEVFPGTLGDGQIVVRRSR